jgi:hypothetical protein
MNVKCLDCGNTKEFQVVQQQVCYNDLTIDDGRLLLKISEIPDVYNPYTAVECGVCDSENIEGARELLERLNKGEYGEEGKCG